MATIKQSKEAEADLIEIWDYIAQNSEQKADQLIEAIAEKLTLLSESPYMGKGREELEPSIRSFPVGKYILFYRPVEGGIELVRVLHGARDIESFF